MTTVWPVITLNDLKDYLVGAQLNAINTAALAPGQSDRFTDTMKDVSKRIRSKVKSGGFNVVSATVNAVPPELKWAACYLIIEAMQVALPSLQLTANQTAQIERAVDELNRVADGKDMVSSPTDPEATDIQMGSAIRIVTANVRVATASKMSGL